jgi:hypothetical protein
MSNTKHTRPPKDSTTETDFAELALRAPSSTGHWTFSLIAVSVIRKNYPENFSMLMYGIELHLNSF